MLFNKKNINETEKIIYYSNELEDEFAGDNIVAKPIDENYRYRGNGLKDKCSHFFWYKIIAVPLAFFFMKIKFNHKIVNKNKLKDIHKQGFFLYGNHTHFIADALIPTLINVPRDVYVIVHPNNVSMPFLGKITPSLGAIPLPDDLNAARNFMKNIELRIKENKCVMIYPEAHIWPYYTDIRPFKNDSFRYPVQHKCPVYCLTNTYQKKKIGKSPKIVTYIDGPFYPEQSLKSSEQKEKLRNEVYLTMKKRAKQNNVFLIKYEKRNNYKTKDVKRSV